jgi:hypothetical protein
MLDLPAGPVKNGSKLVAGGGFKIFSSFLDAILKERGLVELGEASAVHSNARLSQLRVSFNTTLVGIQSRCLRKRKETALRLEEFENLATHEKIFACYQRVRVSGSRYDGFVLPICSGAN